MRTIKLLDFILPTTVVCSPSIKIVICNFPSFHCDRCQLAATSLMLLNDLSHAIFRDRDMNSNNSSIYFIYLFFNSFKKDLNFWSLILIKFGEIDEFVFRAVNSSTRILTCSTEWLSKLMFAVISSGVKIFNSSSSNCDV